MAYVSNQQGPDEEEENKGQGGVSPNGGAVHLAPSSGVGSTTPTGSTSNPAPSPAGGQFASLDKYVSANQGQAAPLANKITSGITDQYNTLDQQNKAIASNIQGQVQAGTTTDQNGLIAKEAANPTSFASDPNNVASFQKLLNASYTGPLSAENDNGYQGQQAAINNAISQGQAQTQTEAGRQQLLAKNAAKPTAGVTALNGAILSENPMALNQIETAYDPFKNLVSGLGSSAADINKQIVANKAATEQTNQTANTQLGGQLTNLNTSVQDAAKAAQDKLTNQNAQVTGALGNVYGGTPVDTAQTTLGTYGGGTTPWYNTTNYNVGSLSPEVQQLLGLSPDQAAQLQASLASAGTSQMMNGHNFGAGSPTAQIDLSQFLTQTDPTQITAANTATADQYAQANALKQLFGGNMPQNLVLDPAQAAMAGTAPTTSNKFDFNNALDVSQQTAAAERQAGQDEANALTANANAAHDASKHNLFGGVLGTLGKYLVNPLATVPTQISAAKKAATKIV